MFAYNEDDIISSSRNLKKSNNKNWLKHLFRLHLRKILNLFKLLPPVDDWLKVYFKYL